MLFWGGGEDNKGEAATKASSPATNTVSGDKKDEPAAAASTQEGDKTVESRNDSKGNVSGIAGLNIDINKGFENLGDNIVNLGGNIGEGFDNLGGNLAEGTKKIIEEEEYVRRYVTTVLLNTMNQSMWVNINTIPDKWVRYLAVWSIVVYSFFLFYYAGTAFNDGLNHSFLSLQSEQGICSPVIVSCNARVHVGIGSDLQRGLFESSNEFTANSTAIEIELAGYKGDNRGFEALLRSTASNLETLASAGSNRGLPWNYIAWATYNEHIKNSEGSYRFTLLGDISTILDSPDVHVGVASTTGPCMASAARGKVDVTSNNLVLSISNFFNATSMPATGKIGGACPSTLHPTTFGYDESESMGYDLSLEFDTRSIALATSVNMGIQRLSNLERLSLEEDNDYMSSFCNANAASCHGLNVDSFKQYFSLSANNLGMKPIYCASMSLQGVDLGGSCFVRLGDAMLYPVVNHYEEDCADCSKINSDSQLRLSCNEPTIMVGLFYHPGENYSSYPLTIEAVSQFKKESATNSNADILFNAHFYNSSRMTVDGATEGVNRPSDSQVTSAFNTMCPNTTCSMIVFKSSGGSHTINKHNLRIDYAACNNTLYKANTFDELLSTYSQSLTLRERYYECYFFLMENIIFAVGISTGNASIICSLFMWVCFFFLGQYLRYTQNYTTGYADTQEQAEQREEQNRIAKIKAQGGNVDEQKVSSKRGTVATDTNLTADNDDFGDSGRGTNGDGILELMNRLNKAEALLAKQQTIIEQLMRIYNNYKVEGGGGTSSINSAATPSTTIGAGETSSNFSTSKGTGRKYTAQQHKEMMEHLTNLHLSKGGTL